MSLSLLFTSRRYVGGGRKSDGLHCIFAGTLRKVITLALAAVPSLARAQDVPGVQTSPDTADVRPSSQLSVALGRLLPVVRPLGQSPLVSEVGRLTMVTGAMASMPITPATALIDLRMYRTQLSSLFPISAPHYPADSLRQVFVARAAHWVARLRAARSAVDGRQLVAFAQLATLAGQDTLAHRLFDQRLAELTSTRSLPPGERTVPIERSLTLGAAVESFSDATLDSGRLVANLPLARVYTAQLIAIPSAGYGNRSDSTVVLYRKFDAAVALLIASAAIHATADVLAQSDYILSLIPRFGLRERFSLLAQRYPYREVAATLVAQPHGRARLDTLNARLFALGIPRNVEFPADMPEDHREIIRRQSRSMIEARIASSALIGREAPAISAHAWLNTPDSLYSSTPRTRHWNDGIIHILVFGGREQDNLVILERVQQHFPTGVQAVFVTSTEGNVGPDIKPPGDEVAWLRGFYRDIRHVTMPIAVWAGAKVPGPLNVSKPMPSPVYGDYYVGFLSGLCVIVGGDGIVRGYEPLQTREDEAKVIGRIERLRTLSTPKGVVSMETTPSMKVTAMPVVIPASSALTPQ